jgi:hypothetical protein
MKRLTLNRNPVSSQGIWIGPDITEIYMNLKNTPRTAIRRNGCWLLRLTDLTVNGLPATGTADRQAWEIKISLLERFNGWPFNIVPAGTAANDETWRIAA